MDTYAATISGSSMIQGDDDIYYGMVPVSKHSMEVY